MHARSPSSLPFITALATALAAACGSVVVEPGPEGGAAGGTTSKSTTTATTTTTGSSGSTTTTTSGGNVCTSAADCPSMSACAPAACNGGVCAIDFAPPGASCPEGVCDGAGQCVECVADSDCGPGEWCSGGNSCLSTCTDGIQNGDETDVDCGGSCVPCVGNPPCPDDFVCASAYCLKGECVEAILISEVRTSGPAADGFSDDFVELQNPGVVPIIFDPSWVLWHRSAQGGCQGKIMRYQGKGQVIPPLGHLLLRGLGYSQSPAADDVMENVNPGMSLADAGSIWIEHGGQVIDALCFAYDPSTFSTILSGMCVQPYICMGMPASNLPHTGTGMGPSAADVSLSRRVDVEGHPINTRDNAVDFENLSPAAPQSSTSP